MKQEIKLNGQARLFSKALQSAIGSGSLSRKGRVASNENLKIAEAKPAPNTDHKSTEVMASSIDSPIQTKSNGSFFTNHVVETNPSLLASMSDPHPWVDINHLPTIQETWKENLMMPKAQTYWPSMHETESAVVMAPSFENPYQTDINGNECSFPANSFRITSPSDLHFWVQNSHLASIQETLCMATDNEDDVWIKNNRLMALQQLGYDSPDQYSSSSSLSPPYNIDSTGKMFPDMIHNPSDYWDNRTILPQSSRNSLSSESNSLKDVLPVYEEKYEFENQEKTLLYQQAEMKSEWSLENRFLKDQSPQENSVFLSEEQAVSIRDGRTEYVLDNTNQLFEKSYPERQLELKNIQVKNSRPENNNRNCCGTFHDKQAVKNKKNVAKMPSYDAKSLMTLESTTGFFDSHCHIDFLFNREKFYGTYADYMAQHKDSYPKSYKGCIAVFCKPHMFAKKYLWQKHLEEDNVYGAFGCHPKSARFYNDRIEKDLEAALNHPKVKALGEIGLDYSIGNECTKFEQHYVFRRQLKIAKRRNLRLVIHCRDADDDTIKIMREILPKDTIFHLHCFTGSWERAQRWIAEFPNVFIGITNLVTFSSAVETHEVARKLPLERLLLETDAPYFVPPMAPRGTKFSHPGMAIHVAAQIAAFKDVPVDKVLQWTSANTKVVYKLP